jgi:arylsulfatase A-like enzyme
MSRRRSGALLLALGLLACQPEPPAARNVVLVSIDALGAGHVSAYGYERPTTPNLDALAAEGALFESAYTQQLWTLTSHLTMLTGLHPQVHGASRERPASPDATSLAAVLKQHGFRTGAFTGAYGFMSPIFGLGRGFDQYVMRSEKRSLDPAPIVRWIKQQARLQRENPEHRFFLFVHYYDVHSDAGTLLPYDSPPAYRRKFWPKGLRWNRRGDTRLLVEMFRDGASEQDKQAVTALYDASVNFTDEMGLRPVVEALRTHGFAEDTLLIVTSDHGEEIFEHESYTHQLPYQESTRVPLVVRGPRVPRGVRIRALAALVDIAPTVLSLLSLPVPKHAQGRDLSPLLRGEGPVNDAVYVDGRMSGYRLYPSSVIADVDGGRWSYINTVRTREDEEDGGFFTEGPGELYDLLADAGQVRDLAAERPELAERLEQQLLDWYRANALMARVLTRSEETQLLSEEERALLQDLGYLE